MIKKNIPKELRTLNNWCVHVNKTPYRPYLRYGKIVKAKSTDMTTWGKLEQAIELVGNTYKENIHNQETKKYDIEETRTITGLSFAITSPYVAIDLDHVINSYGEILPEAKEIIENINSYTEISVSKTGIHIILKTDKPLPKEGFKGVNLSNKKGWNQTEEKHPAIEIYQSKRIMTFTNDVYMGKTTLNTSTDELYKLYDTYFKDREEKAKNPKQKVNFTPYTHEDKDVINKAEEVITTINQLSRGNTKEKFTKLFNGDTSDYNSASEADFALCGILSRFTQDTTVIDYIYQISGLYKDRFDKWNRLDYKKSTIEKAIKTRNLNPKGFKVNDKGNILHTKENVKVALNNLGYKIGYNVLTNEVGITNKVYSNDIGYFINELYSYCRGLGFNIKKTDLEEYIFYIASDNRYNPFRDYLIRCEEVTNPYGELEKLMSTLVFDIPMGIVKDHDRVSSLYRSMIKKFLISIVALNYENDLRKTQSKPLEGTLILKGGQGIGKTTWLKNLVPAGYFKEGAILENSKDNKIENYKYILVELGELETTTNKQATGFLKQELTRTSIEYRPPYAKSMIKFARHTVFCGSVNEDTFLRDTTGNRRFWVIPVKNINNNVDVDVNKLWSEIIQLYRFGMVWHLDSEERKLLDELNNDYVGISSIGMAIQNTFDFSKPRNEWIFISINSVYELIREQVKVNNINNNIIGEQLRLLGCERVQKRIIKGHNPIRVWVVPPTKIKYWKIDTLEIWKQQGDNFRLLTVDNQGNIN